MKDLSKETKINYANFLNDLEIYIKSMYKMNEYIQTINEKANKKEEEVQDFLHYNEFLNLSKEEKVKYYDYLQEVANDRRNIKDIKTILNLLSKLEVSINKKSTIKEFDKKLNDKIKVLTDDRQYNVRSKNSIDYLERIFNLPVCKDIIKKGMKKEDFSMRGK